MAITKSEAVEWFYNGLDYEAGCEKGFPPSFKGSTRDDYFEWCWAEMQKAHPSSEGGPFYACQEYHPCGCDPD